MLYIYENKHMHVYLRKICTLGVDRYAFSGPIPIPIITDQVDR